MPFSRSRSIESMTRSLTEPSSAWWIENAPHCQSIASTRVVLPWSTWATIATLRRSSRRRGSGQGMRERSFRRGRWTLECHGRARVRSHHTTLPVGRGPGAPPLGERRRPAGGRARPRRRTTPGAAAAAVTLRRRGTAIVTISSSSSRLSAIGPLPCRTRVGHQLADEQLGRLVEGRAATPQASRSPDQERACGDALGRRPADASRRSGPRRRARRARRRACDVVVVVPRHGR